MAQIEAKTAPNSRAVAKDRRREQLIKATINCIAKRGIAGTTMADVTQDAGLSLGIVNLHFLSKDKLFEETLLYLSDEYEAFCANALKKAGHTAVEKLTALAELDFSPKVCDRKNWRCGSLSGVKQSPGQPICRFVRKTTENITMSWQNYVRTW